MLFLVVAGFITLDFCSGMLVAFIKGLFSSSVMRMGLVHKIGSVMAIMVGVFADWGQQFVDIGLTIPVTKGICVYIIIMEIGSIIENIGVINPKIVPDKLTKYFIKLPTTEKE